MCRHDHILGLSTIWFSQIMSWTANLNATLWATCNPGVGISVLKEGMGPVIPWLKHRVRKIKYVLGYHTAAFGNSPSECPFRA